MSDMFCRNIRSKYIDGKIRFFCSIEEKEDAKNFYLGFWRTLQEPLKSSIFLEFPEEVYVKHGDIEAKKYEDYMREQQ